MRTRATTRIKQKRDPRNRKESKAAAAVKELEPRDEQEEKEEVVVAAAAGKVRESRTKNMLTMTLK